MSLGFGEGDIDADSKWRAGEFGSPDGTVEAQEELSVRDQLVSLQLSDESPPKEMFLNGVLDWNGADDGRHPFGGGGLGRGVDRKKRESFLSITGGLVFNGRMQMKAMADGYYQIERPDTSSWLNNLFPALQLRPGKTPAALPDPEGWSLEALALSRSLLRVDALSQMPDGLELKRTVDGFDQRWKRQSSHDTDLVLYSPMGWLTRTLDLDEQTLVNYTTGKERGVFSLSLLLGRVRASVPAELTPNVLGLNDSSLAALHESYRFHVAKVEPAGENRVKLRLSPKPGFSPSASPRYSL